MSAHGKSTEYFFASGGGTAAPVNSEREPFEGLDALTAVVGAPCPTRPLRETSASADELRR